MTGCLLTNAIRAIPSAQSKLRSVPAWWQVVGLGWLNPDLLAGGGQVAILRLHAASAGHVTKPAYSWAKSGHVARKNELGFDLFLPNFSERRLGRPRCIRARTRVGARNSPSLSFTYGYAVSDFTCLVHVTDVNPHDLEPSSIGQYLSR